MNFSLYILHMKIIYISLFFFKLFLIPTLLTASDEDWKIYKDEKENSIIWVSKNGEITYGDNLSIRILESDCIIGNTLTTFYSSKPIEFAEEAEGKFIRAKFGGHTIHAQVLFASEFLLGKAIWVDLGWNSLTDIKDFFKDKPRVTLKLEHGEGFNLEDYFDVLQNTWQTEGIDQALDKAVKICQDL